MKTSGAIQYVVPTQEVMLLRETCTAAGLYRAARYSAVRAHDTKRMKPALRKTPNLCGGPGLVTLWHCPLRVLHVVAVPWCQSSLLWRQAVSSLYHIGPGPLTGGTSRDSERSPASPFGSSGQGASSPSRNRSASPAAGPRALVALPKHGIGHDLLRARLSRLSRGKMCELTPAARLSSEGGKRR